MRLGALAVITLAAVTACGGSKSSSVPADESVTVYAASSLSGPFKEIAAAFEAAHPGSKVTLDFAASSELAAQINQGAPADVFASADLTNMKKLADGTIGVASEFATNRLQIIVGVGNPKGITGLADLAKPGVTFVSADPSVPIGKYAQQVLDKAGVKVTPASLEANVKGIVTKVTLGEADAGIVYVTDVLAAGAKAQGVDIPADVNVIAHYPIGVPAKSAHAASGADFVAFVLSSAGQQILAKYGFASA
jgi:molybdate transport system substrate-binding protein